MEPDPPRRKLKVGIIGLGEVAQVIHLPTLSLLSSHFTTTAVCDISPAAVAHCTAKFNIDVTHGYTSHQDLINNTDVEVVFILSSDEYHEEQCIAALKAGKDVLVEKPLTLSATSAKRILAAEKESRGRVFVAYMRRYAPTFQAFKNEVAAVSDHIEYARVRDIVGPNSTFVSQSSTFPIKFTADLPPSAAADRDARVRVFMKEVLPRHLFIYPSQIQLWRLLNSLGSHDLSLMRETFGGAPVECNGVSWSSKFFVALLQYPNFNVTYETGIDELPRFDAHIEVYAGDKSVKIEYDTPYVKGLPIVMTVEQKEEGGGYSRKETRSSYQDAYTTELLEFWRCIVEGGEIKTTAADAMEDLEMFEMIMHRAFGRKSSGLYRGPEAIPNVLTMENSFD